MDDLERRRQLTRIRNGKHTLGSLTRTVTALSAEDRDPLFVEFATEILNRVPQEEYNEDLPVCSESGVLNFLVDRTKKEVESSFEDDDLLS